MVKKFASLQPSVRAPEL